MNVELKQAIVDSGMKQTFIAQVAGLSEWRLSRIIHGRTPPTKDEKQAIAAALGKQVHALFAEVAA
jgi:DNA-binding XRE family transcriptional regulator